MASSAIGIPEAIIAQEQIKQQRNAAARAQAQAVWERSEQQKRDDMTSKYQAQQLAIQENAQTQRHAEALQGFGIALAKIKSAEDIAREHDEYRLKAEKLRGEVTQWKDLNTEERQVRLKMLVANDYDPDKTEAEFQQWKQTRAGASGKKPAPGVGDAIVGAFLGKDATGSPAFVPPAAVQRRQTAQADLHDIRGLEKIGLATGNISKELDVQLKTINNKYQDEIKRLTRGKDQRQLKLMDEEIKRKQQEIALHKDLDPLQVANARMSGRLTFNKLEMSDMDKNVRKFITANDPNAFQYITKPGTQFLKARGDAFNKAFEARKVVDHYTLMADGYKKAKAVAEGNAAGMKALSQSKDATLSSADKTKAGSKALTYDAEAKQWQNAIDDVTANLGVAKQDFDQKSALKADYINADVKMKNGTRVIDPTTGRPSKKLTDGMLHSMNGAPPPRLPGFAQAHPHSDFPVRTAPPPRKPAQKAGAKKPIDKKKYTPAPGVTFVPIN